MQIRCNNCHKPFALSKEAVHTALETVMAEELSHFNAYCPHCRRANRISKQELLRAAPDWKPGSVQEEGDTEAVNEEINK
jgi:phage FluMu protein Com